VLSHACCAGLAYLFARGGWHNTSLLLRRSVQAAAGASFTLHLSASFPEPWQLALASLIHGLISGPVFWICLSPVAWRIAEAFISIPPTVATYFNLLSSRGYLAGG
jgi:hypothetical protein